MMDLATGSLMVLKPLDAEAQKNFNLTVEVTNKQNHRINCNFEVIVEDINDNSPITNLFYYAEVPSNATGTIITVNAIDNDISRKHNEVIFSLLKNERRFKVGHSE